MVQAATAPRTQAMRDPHRRLRRDRSCPEKSLRQGPATAAGAGMLGHGGPSREASAEQDPSQIPYSRAGQAPGELETWRGLGLRHLLPADFSFIFNTQRNRR